MFGRNKRKGEVCIDIKVNIAPVQYVRLLSQCRNIYIFCFYSINAINHLPLKHRHLLHLLYRLLHLHLSIWHCLLIVIL